MRWAVSRARRSAQMGFAAKMSFVQDYAPSLPPTYADPDQLLQVDLPTCECQLSDTRIHPLPFVRHHCILHQFAQIRNYRSISKRIPMWT